MNKRFVMIIIFVFTVVLLCSCSKTKTKEEILKEAENYTSTSTEYDSFAYQADIGKWLAPETEYNYDKN